MLTKSQQKRHSRMGSISFVIGLMSLVGACCGVIALPAGVVATVIPVTVPMIGLGWTTLCAILGAPVDLIGIGLGAAGFFERDADHVPNILGIVLCVLSLVTLAVGALVGHVITAPLGPPPPNL